MGFEMASLGQLLEAGMLICFGVSWPVAIFKTWRTRRTEGKSLTFLVLIFAGYLSGIVAKFFRAAVAGAPPEPVTILYGLNAVFVGADILLYLRHRPRAAPAKGGPADRP